MNGRKKDEDGEGEQLKRVEQKGISLPLSLTRRPLESDRREKYQEREKQREYSLQERERREKYQECQLTCRLSLFLSTLLFLPPSLSFSLPFFLSLSFFSLALSSLSISLSVFLFLPLLTFTLLRTAMIWISLLIQIIPQGERKSNLAGGWRKKKRHWESREKKKRERERKLGRRKLYLKVCSLVNTHKCHLRATFLPGNKIGKVKREWEKKRKKEEKREKRGRKKEKNLIDNQTEL